MNRLSKITIKRKWQDPQCALIWWKNKNIIRWRAEEEILIQINALGLFSPLKLGWYSKTKPEHWWSSMCNSKAWTDKDTDHKIQDLSYAVTRFSALCTLRWDFRHTFQRCSTTASIGLWIDWNGSGRRTTYWNEWFTARVICNSNLRKIKYHKASELRTHSEISYLKDTSRNDPPTCQQRCQGMGIPTPCKIG